MGDVVINGGKYGFIGGNQQWVECSRSKCHYLSFLRFTVKNFEINNAKTAIRATWNWGE